MEGQLAGKESELHAMQRRALRTEAASASEAGAAPCKSPNDAEDDVEVAQLTATLQAVEMRTAALKQQEMQFQNELREALSSRCAVRSSLAGRAGRSASGSRPSASSGEA